MHPQSSLTPATLCRQVSLSEINFATNNFSSDLIIGTGSFGTVYKATIDPIATSVAVKRRSFDSKQGSFEFWTEVNLLSNFQHTHLISLIGYCFDHDDNEMILVYEYMANGTLADHIYKSSVNSSCLSWEQRVKICIGVACGVEYLHIGNGIDKTVIHRDLKSSNILLDADWVAKISDFGLCKSCSPVIATKVDVYAFGVVLLEVLCGRRSLDFEVVDREKKLVLWVQQCIREGFVHTIIDPHLRGNIADDGLLIFLDITVKCLQDRPDKRPSMVEVVARLEAVLASQYTTCSFSSVDDEFIKIYFLQVAYLNSSAYSDVDPPRLEVETGSGKNYTIKQVPVSNLNITTVRSFMKSKSTSIYDALYLPPDLQLAATSHNKYDEYEKLVRIMNPPRVTVDNESCENATVIELNSTSTQGVLLELLQVLTDFDLIVTKASRTSDGSWFLDVFYALDQEGFKVTDKAKIQNQHKVLGAYSSFTSPMERNLDEKSFPNNHTTIELIGKDRLGLISEISAILSDLQCNVVCAEIWTHSTRFAAVIRVSDEETKYAVIEPVKLSEIENKLLVFINGGNDNMMGVYGLTEVFGFHNPTGFGSLIKLIFYI